MKTQRSNALLLNDRLKGCSIRSVHLFSNGKIVTKELLLIIVGLLNQKEREIISKIFCARCASEMVDFISFLGRNKWWDSLSLN